MQRTFALENRALVETSSEVLGKVSLEDFNGTNWLLVDLAGGQEAPLQEAEISLSAAEAT